MDECTGQNYDGVVQQICSVFMCVGHKPQPFGNKMHTICCGLTYIWWGYYIVEGKYRPKKIGQK